MLWRKLPCINGTRDLSMAMILLPMNRGQATLYLSQQRKLKQSKSCWTLIAGWLFDSDRRMTKLKILSLWLGIPLVPWIIHNELCIRRICASWISHMIDENRSGMLQTAILQHDNTASHRAVQNTKTIKWLLDNPLTHQTWPPCNYFLFPLIKSVLRDAIWGRCWSSSCNSEGYLWTTS